MKLSTKIILPIILISALLILLNGCISTVPDDSPGYTPGTITGIIASPCCSTSDETADGETASPEYWCYYCQNSWKLQDGIEVVLTYGEDEVTTTTTNDKGEFTFTNVDPGKNYVVTAYCPDFADNRPLVKDVALEITEGGSFDTKTTDLVSTSLGLVVDFLVLYTELGPEDILLEGVIADKPSFPNFPKFKALVYEVRRVVENCELNLLTDDDVQEALCLAAEEISKLDIGCAPGATPPPPSPTPTPTDPCAGNTAPYDVSLVVPSPSVVVGETYSGTVSASDDDVGDTLTFGWTAGFEPPGDMAITSAGVITWNPGCGDICDCGSRARLEIANGCTLNIIKVTVDDGCDPVDAEFCIEVTNDIPAIDPISNTSVCCAATFTQVVTVTDADVPDHQTLTFTLDAASVARGMSIEKTGNKTAEISWITGCGDVGTHPVVVEVSDGCCEPVQEEFDVTVENDIPAIDPIPNQSVCCAQEFSYEVTVTDANVPGCQTLTFDLDTASKDRGMSIEKTGDTMAIITWIPGPGCEDVCGCFDFERDSKNRPLNPPISLGECPDVTVTVSDGCCEPVRESFCITVKNDKPEFTSLAPITLNLGDEYVYEIVVGDSDVCGPRDCQTLTFALVEGPTGMVLDDAFGGPCKAELTWTPGCEDLEWTQVCESGDCQDLYKSVVHVKIEVDDGCCDPIYKEFDITVYLSNMPPEIDESYILENIPVEICNGSTYCFELKATDDDGDNLNWELIETNAGGIVYFSDDEGMSASLCWEPANCGPVMEKGRGELFPELCTQYFIVRVYDDGCPELYDEFCFYVTVRTCPPLHLYEKDNDWLIVNGGAEGLMTYNRSGHTLDFVFDGYGLLETTSYTLIYYPDPWPGDGLICLESGTTDGSGNVSFTGSVDTGDLPIASDTNAGAKIWLVLSADVDCDNDKMVGWNPTEYLFENNLIAFDDIDVP